MLPNTLVRPGCFGSPLCFNEVREMCEPCVFNPECEAEAAARSMRLKQRFGLQEIIRPPQAPRRAAKPMPVTAGVAKPPAPAIVSLVDKVATVTLERLTISGINLKDSIAQGRNPLPLEPPDFMSEAVTLLLDGGCNAANLSQRLKLKFGWGDQTALTHAIVAVKVLQWSGAARFDTRRNCLTPCVDEQHQEIA